LITIEDFKEEYFDEILEILRIGFDIVDFKYSKEEKKFAEEILLNKFLSPGAKAAKFGEKIKAGASLKGKESFHFHEGTILGRQVSRELIKKIEESAKCNGNNELFVYTLIDWKKIYREPFLREGYEIVNENVSYPLDIKPGKKFLRVYWMVKQLK